jgi:hypothetical protein
MCFSVHFFSFLFLYQNKVGPKLIGPAGYKELQPTLSIKNEFYQAIGQVPNDPQGNGLWENTPFSLCGLRSERVLLSRMS